MDILNNAVFVVRDIHAESLGGECAVGVAKDTAIEFPPGDGGGGVFLRHLVEEFGRFEMKDGKSGVGTGDTGKVVVRYLALVFPPWLVSVEEEDIKAVADLLVRGYPSWSLARDR